MGLDSAFQFSRWWLGVDFGVQGARLLACAPSMINHQVSTILGWAAEILLSSIVCLLYKIVVAEIFVILAILLVSQLTANFAT